MPSLSFKTRFVEAILAGTKNQTIRAPRRQPIHVGDTLYLFTGMRTKHCRRLATVRCVAVGKITLNLARDSVSVIYPERAVGISGPAELHEFSRRDGFASWEELKAFWLAEHGEPIIFRGEIYRWEPLQQ